MDFFQPEISARFGHNEVSAAFMPMPEAAVNEDDSFVFGKNNIGLSWKCFIVQLVTETFGVQEPSHEHFGLGILALDAAHVVAAGLRIVHIGHALKLPLIRGIQMFRYTSARKTSD